MRTKRILVHGTPESLKSFFGDAISRDYEVVAILSEEPEKISIGTLEVFAPKNLPAVVVKLVDGIIFTGKDKSAADYFLRQGVAPHKVILWDAAYGWIPFGGLDQNGTQTIFFGGLEFHITSNADAQFFNETAARLQNQRHIKNLNPMYYPAVVAQDFQRRTGKTLDFNNPRTFTEKLQWLKIFDATPTKSRLADKYLVRRWVADKIGEEHLIPLLGAWNDFDDINFDELPDKFVLKCNHGSGMNIIVRDKKSFDRRNAREKLNAWLAVDYAAPFLELHYTRINRKIIAEQFMANGDLPDIDNYKFWCFNGAPIHCALESGRSADGRLDNLRMDFFDENWQPTTVERSDHPRSDHPEKIPRPKKFKLMKKFAAKLAEEFAFVRVDFYEVDGHVYFGEMTFTPGAGNFYYKSAGTDEYLGGLLTLPNFTPPPAALGLIVKSRFARSAFVRRRNRSLPVEGNVTLPAGIFLCYHGRKFLGR